VLRGRQDFMPAMTVHMHSMLVLHPQHGLIRVPFGSPARSHSPKSRPTPYVTCGSSSRKLTLDCAPNRQGLCFANPASRVPGAVGNICHIHCGHSGAQHALHSPQRCLMTSLQADALSAGCINRAGRKCQKPTPMAIRPPTTTRVEPRSMLAPPRAAPTAPKMASPTVEAASTTASLQAGAGC
jgi:hypothetical protein